MIIQNCKNEDEFITETVKIIMELNPKTIALSGGKTPLPIYKALSLLDLSGIEFFQVDERYVPTDHPNSNYKMIKHSLGLEIHHFDTDLPIEKSLKKYSQELPLKFDICILGIGNDGHTASIFPHSDAIDSENTVAHTQTDQFEVKDRLTITFKQILSSKNILVLIKDKPKIIEKLMNPKKNFSDFPALRLLENKNLTIVTL